MSEVRRGISSEQGNAIVWDGQSRRFYEVWYLKLNHRATGCGLWLRYTFLSPVAGTGDPVAELWGIFFDPHDPKRNQAMKQTLPASETGMGRETFSLRFGSAELTNASARGTLRRDSEAMAWDLAWTPNPETFAPFPMSAMYRTRIPKTKFLSPNLSIRFRGSFTVHGETYVCDGEPGQQAHLWGTKSADQWAWAHCNAFEEDENAVFEGLSASVRIGIMKIPNLTMLHLRAEEGSYTFNSVMQLFTNKSRPGIERWEFSGENQRWQLHGVITARIDDFVGVRYIDPDGAPLYCHNSKVASCEIALCEPTGGAWYPVGKLTSHGTTAFEWVSRAPDPRVPVRI